MTEQELTSFDYTKQFNELEIFAGLKPHLEKFIKFQNQILQDLSKASGDIEESKQLIEQDTKGNGMLSDSALGFEMNVALTQMKLFIKLREREVKSLVEFVIKDIKENYLQTKKELDELKDEKIKSTQNTKTNREKILNVFIQKPNEELTLSQIGETLNMKVQIIDDEIIKFLKNGLIQEGAIKIHGGAGRPAKTYIVTDKLKSLAGI